jgi:hypothetical protein
VYNVCEIFFESESDAVQGLAWLFPYPA